MKAQEQVQWERVGLDIAVSSPAHIPRLHPGGRDQFIDDHRDVFGVEPICTVLPIAPSTYHRHRHQRTSPTRRSAWVQRDDQLHVALVHNSIEG